MRKTMMTALVAVMVLGATHVATAQQVTSPTAAGYIERARMMMDDGNYTGCIDQARHAMQLPVTAQQRSQATLLTALATVHTDKGRAADMLREWLADNGASPERYRAAMALADCYYGSDYAQALDLYAAIPAVALNSAERADLDYKMAYCDIQLGRYAEALVHLDGLKESRTYGNAAEFYRGYVRYAQGDYATALPMMQQAARYVQPPCDMAPYYVAQMEYARGNYAEALAAAKQLLDRNVPRQYVAEATRLAGESAWHQGDEATALSYLNKYMQLTDTPTPSALYIVGLDAYRNGHYDLAIKDMQPATELGDAMSQSAYLYIGQAQMRLDDYSGAALSLDRALSMDYDPEVQEAAYYNYAVASIKGGKVPFGNTVATLQNFLQKFPDSRYAPQAQEFIVTSYINDGNYAAALQSINAMARPTQATLKAKQRVLYLLGSGYLASNPAQAIDYLSQAVKMTNDPEVALESKLALGEAYLRDGKYADAATQLTAYVAQSRNAANLAIAQYDLGYAQLKQHRYADGAAALQKAVSAGTLDRDAQADAYARLGDCLYYQNKYQQAADAYDRAYTANPAVGDYALYQRALMQGYQRHHQDKIDLLQRMQREYPKSALIPDALLEMTESYTQLGQSDQALAVYRRLVSEYPQTAQGRQGYLQMALTLLNNGQKTEAVKTYREVVTRYPTSAEAAIATDQLKRIAANDGTLTELMAFLNSVPGAQRMEASEADNLAYEAAEVAYISGKGTQLLADYVARYTDGAHRAKALSYLVGELAASNPDEAYTYAVMLVEQYPDTPQAVEALATKAQIEQDQGKGNLALRSWQQLADRASTPAQLNAARLGVLRTATDIGDDATAIEAGEALLAASALTSAQRDEATYLTAVAYSRRGDEQRARSLWLDIADRVGDIYGIRSAYNLANSYYRAKDYDQAEAWAQNVANANSEHIYWIARGFILLADVYTAQGDTYKAQQYLTTLRDKYPGNESDIFTMIDQRLK